MRMFIARARRDADDGVSLIFAMVFVVGVGVVVLALLSYTGTSVISAGVTGANAKRTYDVGNALRVAINDIRNSTYDNAMGESCLGGGKSYPVSNGSADNIVVACDPGPGTGAAGGLVPIKDSNKPGLALLTLSTDPNEDGILNQKNNVLYVHGGMYSNSTVTSSGGTDCPNTWTPLTSTTNNCNMIYNDIAPITAEGSCTGKVVSAVAVNCNQASASAGDDPASAFPTAYAQPTSGMVRRTIPDADTASNCPAQIVHFTPGLYEDAAALSKWTDGSNVACKGKTLVFDPGVFYFDFRDLDANKNNPDQWKISNPAVYVIGGTPSSNWKDGKPTTLPGACVSPLEKVDAGTGTMFVFGGDSQLAISQGNVEVCGQWYDNKPFFAVYGAKDTTGPSLSGPFAVVPSGNNGTITTGNGGSWSNPQQTSDVNAVDASAVTWTQGTSGQTNGSITFKKTTSSGIPAAVPAKAVLKSAILKVRHKDSTAWTASSKLVATVTLNPSLPQAQQISVDANLKVTPTNAFVDDSVDVTDQLSRAIYAAGITDATQVATVALSLQPGTGTTGAKMSFDYVELNLSWYPVGMRGQSAKTIGIENAKNCITLVPVGPNKGCALISTDSNQSQQLYLTGTVYAPLSAMAIFLNGISGKVFRSGLIARSVNLQITASNQFAGPVIQVPDNLLAPAPLDVFLTAYTCPSGVSVPTMACTKVGSSQVRIIDKSFTVTPGDRPVKVVSWNVS